MMLLRRLLTLAVLVLACPLASQAAEPVFPPGVRVGLTPIDGLKPAASFPGFENEAAGIKVLIAGTKKPAQNDYVSCTGIARIAAGGEKVLQMRTDDDLIIRNP